MTQHEKGEMTDNAQHSGTTEDSFQLIFEVIRYRLNSATVGSL